MVVVLRSLTSSRSDVVYGSGNRRKSWEQFQRFLFRTVVWWEPSSWESMVLEQVETSKKVRRTARIARRDSASSSCVAWFRQENEARQTRLRDRDRRRFLGGEV